ncbi:hypothetical protein [Flaviflexus equikiangi]|uniref:VCBS repeat-containing protein n=1 Tax=Flaviflexus equikiangi TaxID=2758573 RepID=A0ABS2THY7_9ACTO|nr:hypothetical protein [Flaviflexus equikiangi]MBM9433397.1 hypothetical protein [Flaviflexus equikiangi]
MALAGDFDGDGIDTIAVRRSNALLIANRHTGGIAQSQISIGSTSDTLLIGDWNGNGMDTPAIN